MPDDNKKENFIWVEQNNKITTKLTPRIKFLFLSFSIKKTTKINDKKFVAIGKSWGLDDATRNKNTGKDSILKQAYNLFS